MKPRIGEKFQGAIQGFSPKAAFVRPDSPFVEVGVPLIAVLLGRVDTNLKMR